MMLRRVLVAAAVSSAAFTQIASAADVAVKHRHHHRPHLLLTGPASMLALPRAMDGQINQAIIRPTIPS